MARFQWLCIRYLVLSVCNLGIAQPSNHRYGSRANSHALEALYEEMPYLTEISDGAGEPVSTLEADMSLQDSTIRLWRNPQLTNALNRRDVSGNSELQAKLENLDAALQSLRILLSLDYGIDIHSESSGSTVATPAASKTTAVGAQFSSASATTIRLQVASSFASSAFDPMSSANVAVYYSQSPLTSEVSLTDICSDPTISIVVLAFVSTFFGPGGYPSLNLGPNCWAASSAQSAAGATGLIDCVSDNFVREVQDCQDAGKIVMLSLGGAKGYSDTRIPSEAAANLLASTLWDLFLGGKDNDTINAIRPFGDFVFDGIDLDNESGDTFGIMTLMSSLRSLFASDSSKAYYLSAAPQCPRPDASVPLSALQTVTDFIFVQFYNNPSCNLGTEGFLSSLQAWTSDVSEVSQANFGGISMGEFQEIGNGVVGGPRVYVGMPSFAAAGSSGGFVDGSMLENIMREVAAAGFANLGGVMMWDGSGNEVSSTSGATGTDETFSEIVNNVLG